MDVLSTLTALADRTNELRHVIGRGQHMIGTPDTGSLVVGVNGVRTHVAGDGDPGFEFSADGTTLRTGPRMEIQASADNIGFAGWYLNPLTFLIPQTIVNPYPLWVRKMDDSVVLVKTFLGL